MTILWCEEHAQAEDGEGLCHRGKYLTPCRMVPMRLIPDNAQPAGMLAYGEFIPYDIWLNHLPVAAPVDQVVALYALDGETP